MSVSFHCIHPKCRDLREGYSFVNIHDDAARPAIEVKTINDAGFQFVDGLLVPSPCIFINGTLFMWDAPPVPSNLKWEGWTIEHFKIYDVVAPRPGPSFQVVLDQHELINGCDLRTEILLIGTGKSMMPLPPFLKKYLNGLGIQVDVQDSVCAMLFA